MAIAISTIRADSLLAWDLLFVRAGAFVYAAGQLSLCNSHTIYFYLFVFSLLLSPFSLATMTSRLGAGPGRQVTSGDSS